MSSTRKCKACLRPVKGHPGAYGIAKCKNVPLVAEENMTVTKTIEVKVVNENDVDEAKNESEKSEDQENIVQNLVKLIKAVTQPILSDDCCDKEMETEMENPSPVVENTAPELENSPTEMNNTSHEDETNIKYDNECSDDENDDSHFIEAPVVVCHDVKSNEEDASMEVSKNISKEDGGLGSNFESPDCSLGEASLCFEMEAGGDEEGRRLASMSDTNVDIRNLVIGRGFVLCLCDNYDCECEGEIHFSASLEDEVGVVENLFMDPLTDFETDFLPKMTLAKTGWKAKEPNCIKFKLGGVSAEGVASSSGEVVLTSSRVVEMVKGRKSLSTVIMGKLELSLKLKSEYTKKGIKNPMKFKPIECNLYMIDDEEDAKNVEDLDVSEEEAVFETKV